MRHAFVVLLGATLVTFFFVTAPAQPPTPTKSGIEGTILV